MFSRTDNGTRSNSGAAVCGRVVGGNAELGVANGGGDELVSEELPDEFWVNGDGSRYNSSPASLSVGSRGG